MRHIRNPVPWIQYLQRLIALRAERARRHEMYSDIEAEMRMVHLMIMDWENRQDRNYVAGTIRSGSSRLGFQKDGLRPGGMAEASDSFRSRPSA